MSLSAAFPSKREREKTKRKREHVCELTFLYPLLLLVSGLHECELTHLFTNRRLVVHTCVEFVTPHFSV
ncbi:hypothetical protein FKM82_008906 [Ascaphus truei]